MDVHPSITIDQMPIVSLTFISIPPTVTAYNHHELQAAKKKWKRPKNNVYKFAENSGFIWSNDKTRTDICFLPLGGLEQSWVKKEEAAVITRKQNLSVSRRVEMVTMFVRAKKKNQATCKKSQGQEHKMNTWKGMGYFVI